MYLNWDRTLSENITISSEGSDLFAFKNDESFQMDFKLAKKL